MTDRDENRTVVPVHECYDDGEAEVVIALLRGNDIEGFANSDVPHSVLPITADGLGKVQVLVNAQIAEKARAIIADSRRQSDSAQSE